ncbi:protein kinase domain-containing protein [Candidatus Entotheonella palauensis]|uniref:protein kinase domain-containing protein n=1 Tax=Candidatus Entotheonella palauensis TaxID=93172 RepID=UPI0015C470F3|nr:protein kinase [Candidatus Entotheonella palauensis]
MRNLPDTTTLPTDARQVHQESNPRVGLHVAMGGQGVLRRISGPEILPLMDDPPIAPETGAAPVATAAASDSKPSTAADDNDVQAELEEAIDKLVGQEIMSFLVISVMSSNAIGGTLLAQHTYLKKQTTIHAIDVAAARARAKLSPQRPRVAKRVQHPNLLRVLHHATHHRFILVFTDAMEGVSVADLLTQQVTMPEMQALTLVQGVCDGLVAGYEEGLTHGGVCPEHIFIGPSGQPKLVDYCWHLYVPEGGLDPFQCHQSVFGSVARWTRAPETFIDGATEAVIDHRADIYALGATLHQMVTGQRPFPAISDPQLRLTQSQTSLKKPHQLNPALSRETSDIITAMIEPNPDRRFSSYHEIRQLLQFRLSGKRGKPARDKKR